MSGKAPPSFSSFPDVDPPKPKPPPPSFASFPAAEELPPPEAASHGQNDEVRPSKRARAADLLNELGREIGISDGDRSGSDERSRRRGGSVRESERHRSGKSKGKERERDRDEEYDDSRRKERRRKRDDEHKGGDWDRESEYGPQRRKPYQLVQGSGSDVPTTKATPPPEAESNKPLFYFQRRPDELNKRFGGNHRGDIPRYRRIGAGRVLGLNEGLRIDKDTAYSGRGVEIGPIRRFKTPRYLDSRSARHITSKHVKRVRLISQAVPVHRHVLGEIVDVTAPPPPQDPFLPSASDPTRFVPFERERLEADRLAELEQEAGQDYRSIAGLVKASDLADESDAEPADDALDGMGIAGGESQIQDFKRRNLEYDRTLRERPTDVQNWLAFIDFQDEVALAMSGAGSSGGLGAQAMSKSERTSTSEIKLSILERALSIEDNKGSEELLLSFLRIVSDLWEAEKVLQRWKATLKDHPRLTGLWIEYVSWRQTNSTNFTIRDVVEVFEECFQVLGEAADAEPIGSAGREALEANSIYLFLRLCLMLRQAGFPERSLAAFQAMIELNVFRPRQHQRPRPGEKESAWRGRVLTDLESYWDSEVPRVGEAGAKGWRDTPDDVDVPEGAADSFPTADTPAGARGLSMWASAERLTSIANPRPARTADPGIDEDVDPFRVILFDDVRDFLFVVHSPDSLTQLTYAFLTFLGLPFIPPDFPTSTPFSTDAFIHSELVERPSLVERYWPPVDEQNSRPFTIVSGEPMESERKSALQAPFDTPFHSTPVTLDLLFAAKPRWFQTLRRDDLQDLDVDLARNALSLLRSALPDTFLSLNLLSFEASQSPKAAVKVAKQILRDSRKNLVLWDGYARVERQRGKLDDARQVYITALSMYRTFAPEDQIDGPLLWRSWAEMEWEAGRPMLALRILVASWSASEVDLASLAANPEERPTSAQVLRARQQFTLELETAFQPNTTQSVVRHRTQIAASAALFEYISRGLPAAVETFEQHIFRLDTSPASGSAEHEEAFMFYVKLLYRHSTAGTGYRPHQLRDVCERAIHEFKNNSLFLSVFYHNELRMKIQNRVRRTFGKELLAKDATSEGWLFAIYAEIQLDSRSPNLWGVRNLFERAITDPKTKSSPSLWTLYIEFELKYGDLRRAKSLIYRAVRECPWCKELYLKPFLPALRPVFRTRELRSWHSSLLEKGLRVRLETDAYIFDEVDSDAEQVGIEAGDDADVPMEQSDLTVAEELLREREELKPY